ncbi:hypothetical protein [Devosia sp.]|uniref:COG4223 family protein n=1 Tax=Devosia sp. TaxID=1871048 RepID=UPI0032653D99
MADAKSGPVKPPVIDLTARDTTAARASETKAAPTASESKPEPRPTPAPRPAATKVVDDSESGGFGFGAMLAGAVLGLGAAYGLAWAGYWPSAAVKVDPRLAQYDKALPELRTEAQTTQAELATLTQRVKALETAPAPAAGTTAAAAPVDLSAIEAEIADLKKQVAAVPAAAAPAVDISGVTGDVATLKTGVTDLSTRLTAAEAGLTKLGGSVDATAAALAKQPADINSVLQLPLILSGLETAFASGRPYEIELAALRAGMPDATVPTEIANAAKTGLVRGDVIAQRFAELLPDILAGRPANPDASWQDGTLDWFRSIIALRPTGAVEGDDPEAVVSRLEAAIGRRDFVAAQALLAKLPAPMVTAAAEVPAQIAAQATAAQLLVTLRDTVLGEAGK